VIAEFEKTQKPAGLLFIDIDQFKKVNDSHGHDVGDQALRMVANTFRHALRATDTLGRWGGEEFVAILYDIDNDKALFKIAEKVRMLVEVSHFETASQSLSVTISIGATRLYSNDTPDSIIRRADGLMYRSKQAGRNRVTIG
jgi:diguanylate cyclase (GGDEF) domain